MSAALHLMLLFALVVIVAPATLYVTTLTVAALWHRPPSPRPGPLRRFALLIPAHNEEGVIERLLDSIGRLDYPPTHLAVYVVADNCTDATAAVARTRRARTYERSDRRRRGKGYALQWLLERVGEEGAAHEAYVVLDADSVVDRGFLRGMNDALAAGSQVAQGYYTILPVRGSWVESLREAALALVHHLRPTGKTTLGLSCGLKGNGMCFARPVLERFGWPVAGLAEDVEFHLLLIAHGFRVRYAPRAVVRGEMPVSLAGAGSQNMRWEAGRLATVRGQALPLLARGVQTRNAAAIDAAVEQLVPPLSVPVAAAALVAVAGAALGATTIALAALACLLLVGAHVAVGLALARTPARTYLALLRAPVYVAWKALLYLRALLGRRESRWIRTERTKRAPAGAGDAA